VIIVLINIIGCKQIGLYIINGLSINNDAYLMKNNILKEYKNRNRMMKTISRSLTEPKDKVSGISLGFEHTCVHFLVDGEVKCFGNNKYGQLGYGDIINRGDEQNEMGNKLPFVNLGKKAFVVLLTAGGYHNCAITGELKYKCWGDNRYGQLMLGDLNNRGDQPNEMGDKLPFIKLGNGKEIYSFATGLFHTCVYSEDSLVYCFGNNEHGQLGYGDTKMRGGIPRDIINPIPVAINHISQISSGSSSNHTCIYVSSGSFITSGAKCWGINSEGQLGYGDTNNRGDEPNEMGENLPFIDVGTLNSFQIFVGGSNTCFLRYDYRNVCFGSNKYGQLGIGNTNNIGDQNNEMGQNLKPMNVGSNPRMYTFMIGSGFICPFFNDYSIKCFGNNDYGQLGQGDKNNRGSTVSTIGDNLPKIDLGNQDEVIHFQVGGSHACVVFKGINEKASEMKCFGKNDQGQLGYGNTNNYGDESNEMGTNLPYVQLRIPPPTRSPSQAPTFAPTRLPTKYPTKKPRKNPTKRPTKNPVLKPVKNN